ncbi:MAG TPA: hypothetical protein VN048_17950, partial [Verrucomicrobiae bacterium]|nr:hypothetical protein [Verrucomicrobiae bacterium]
MARLFQRGAMISVVACLLLAGCATAQKQATEADAENPVEEQKQAEAHAHYAQGLIYEMDDQGDLAMGEFSQAALADPANEELVLNLARRYSQAKQPDKALELLRAASEVPGASTTVWSQLALAYARLGKNVEAEKAAQVVIKQDPASLTGYQDLFIINLQENRVPAALKALNEAAKVPNADPKFLIDLAGMYASLQIAAPAVKGEAVSNGLALLKRLTLPDPPDPQLSLKQADVYNLLGAETNAAQIYLQLLDKYGSLPTLREDLHGKLAEIYLRQHDSKKAE